MPRCTYCGGSNFLEGPSGGASTNILCANKNCRHWFNHSIGELEDLHRVEPTTEERAAAQTAEQDAALALRLKVHAEGVELFQAGYPALSCLKSQNNNRYGFSNADGGDIFRLAGWIDACRKGEEAP